MHVDVDDVELVAGIDERERGQQLGAVVALERQLDLAAHREQRLATVVR